MEQILSGPIQAADLEPELPNPHRRGDDRLRKSAVGRAADLLLLVPDMFVLLCRLIGDGRVRVRYKLLLAGALIYFIWPFDLLPEAILGPIGYLDDLILAAYAVNTILQNTDASVLRQHWGGRSEVLVAVRRALAAADTIVLAPAESEGQGRSVILSEEILPLQAGTTGGGPT